MMTHDVMVVLLSVLTTYSDAVCQVTNCAQCNGNTCDSCNDGYWLETGACIQCPSHCSLCIHNSQCQSCLTSYWNPRQMCNSLCSANCTESGCEDTTGDCYECKPGKYGQRCYQDCSLCINGECDLRKCTAGCRDGYVQYNSGTNSYCNPCSSNCNKCTNTTYCTECEQGFYRDYYRNEFGRGNMQCTQCLAQCQQCTSNEQCPDCKPECIKHRCDVSGVCVTTRSTKVTSGEAAASSSEASTTSLVTIPVTENNLNPTQTNKSGQTTHQPICPIKCMDNCDARVKGHTTTINNSKLEDAYYEGFGHGIATGIGILVVVGILAGVVIFFTRRTKCPLTICPTKATLWSGENHVYINTQEQPGTIPTSRNRPLHTEVNTTSEIHVTLSEEDLDTNREYVSLGERQPENHYSDLQINRRDNQ